MHPLSLGGAIAIFAAGIWAGGINTVVGSGSLVTFPVLVGLGISPFVANVSNNVGLFGGNVSGVLGYRRELEGQKSRVVALFGWSISGGLVGAVLLLVRPSSFRAVVPFLVILGVVMVLVQPSVARVLAERGERRHAGGLVLRLGLFAIGIYGGYFGAAQGVIAIALLSLTLDDNLQRLNALKNVLIGGVNGIAAVVFVIAAPVNWVVVALIGSSSIIGGQIGARYGRRLPPSVLRAIIVVGGIAVSIKLLA